MSVKVVNIVATVFLNVELDLEALKSSLESFGQTVYDPERFPGLIVKTRGTASLLVFRTGKIVVTGVKSLDEVKATLKEFVMHIRDKVKDLPQSVEVQIQNVVATAELGTTVNLEELARKLTGVFYEPEQFPGLIYRSKLGKPVMLIFSTGKVVMVGSRDVEEIEKAYEELKKIISG